MNEIVLAFEDVIKKYNVQFFDKVWEKNKSSWKLIYNINGLNDGSKFYPNLKIIFWLDSVKEELTDNVVSYLYSLDCDYKSMSLDRDIADIFNTILEFVGDEKTNKELVELILNGTDKFNEILKKENIDDFVQNLKFIPSGNKSCIDTFYAFELETNKEKYGFMLKCLPNNVWALSVVEEETKIQMKDIYKKIIEIIYATK